MQNTVPTDPDKATQLKAIRIQTGSGLRNPVSLAWRTVLFGTASNSDFADGWLTYAPFQTKLANQEQKWGLSVESCGTASNCTGSPSVNTCNKIGCCCKMKEVGG